MTFEEKVNQAASRQGVATHAVKSKTWLKSVIKIVFAQSIEKIKEAAPNDDVASKHIYAFGYNNKPSLVYIIDVNNTGFIGINLLALNFVERAMLFDSVSEILANKKSINVKLTFRNGLQRYLYKNITHVPAKINILQWDNILFLPQHTK